MHSVEWLHNIHETLAPPQSVKVTLEQRLQKVRELLLYLDPARLPSEDDIRAILMLPIEQ